MPPKVKPNITENFQGAEDNIILRTKQQLASARQRNRELEARLSSDEKALNVAIERIKPYPHQPRKSFYVVAQKISSFRQHGQKTPIVLVDVPGESCFRIFDGECRFRAAVELGWETIEAIFIPYSPESFDHDIFVSAIYDSGLNNLDLAENLISRIKSILEISQDEIITRTTSMLARIRRKGQDSLLKGLEKKDPETQEQIICLLETDPTEQIIAAKILGYNLNLQTTGIQTFSYLRLPEDIKQHIRDDGLSDSNAKLIGKIKSTNRKLRISDHEALKLREELVGSCLAQNWTKSQTAKMVTEAIADFSVQTTPTPKKGAKILSTLQAIELNDLEEKELLQIQSALATLIEQIDLSIE